MVVVVPFSEQQVLARQCPSALWGNGGNSNDVPSLTGLIKPRQERRKKNWFKSIREQLPLADDDSENGSDNEDEQPQVVTLKKGDLTAEEAMKIKQEIKEALKSNESDGEPVPADGKIMFRKPAKRSSEKLLDFNVSSSKKMKEAKKTKREATTPQSAAKQVKNSSLLSFDDEENDD
ncbi:PREDICTED: uncharacterized protein KIAA1143 homolog [Tauraco erythrolophus]|uniref:uncharacterized protein KIAA1143 homolog n=1 Tax=Tauraco erythrolophus TaxID=121530 RepID=UPI000523EE5C|nr:PREDICTED: uncharacterized protein KIAA1143 homolog [Tauraco erythrolophus]